MTVHNYLPDQYRATATPAINHNYLPQQFADYREILDKIAALVERGDYTLGESVDEFERRISALIGARHTVGLGSGTDAIFLSLKALGVGPGDEVITPPFSFHATVGAIVAAGARPVFADIDSSLTLDPGQIEPAISERTRAIVPVHWSGIPCHMEQVMSIAEPRGLAVVEDACHAIQGRDRGRAPGTFGNAGCFSLHPLKNLNVWGDGGFAVTDDDELHRRLVLLRNHGLANRDEQLIYGHNSRLDTLQAVVALHLLDKLDAITEARIANARYFDAGLADIPGVTIPLRPPDARCVFHLYVIRVEARDEMQRFLVGRGIDAKVHYPIPMHLQPAATAFGYRRGDFPEAEAACDSVLSLPVHKFITQSQQDQVIDAIRDFYLEE